MHVTIKQLLRLQANGGKTNWRPETPMLLLQKHQKVTDTCTPIILLHCNWGTALGGNTSSFENLIRAPLQKTNKHLFNLYLGVPGIDYI